MGKHLHARHVMENARVKEILTVFRVGCRVVLFVGKIESGLVEMAV